tara:strand:- start:47 stop:463 length:417 start_codon:yes stop_codon:yes gene_type:complete
MADAVTSQKIVDTDRKLVYKFTNISDGTGESSVQKIDVSGLNSNSEGEACARITLTHLWYDIGGFRVTLEWDASSNVVCAVLGGSAAVGVVSGYFNFSKWGGVPNNAGSGITGDLDLTTHGHTAHDHYTIAASFVKSY